MATIEERTRGEEILIRLNEIGVSGAHYKTITEYVRDGEVLPGAVINPPVPLALVGGSGGPSLPDLLGDVSAAVLLQFEAAVEQVTELTAKLKTSEDLLAEKIETLDSLTTQAAADAEQVLSLEAALQEANAEIQHLRDAAMPVNLAAPQDPTESQDPA